MKLEMKRVVRSWGLGALTVALGVVGGCADSDSGGPDLGVGGPFGKCHAMIAEYHVASATHVAECSALPEENPPHGGPHYPVWAAFRTYDFPIAHGYLIHSMEHGAVVFYYNCPSGCADEITQAQALIDSQATDPRCSGTGAERRAILVPDPTLDVPWAASAWGYTLRADCFDAEMFGRFYAEHYAKSPEDVCAAGTAFTSSPCQ